jgi:hypothetical protein
MISFEPQPRFEATNIRCNRTHIDRKRVEPALGDVKKAQHFKLPSDRHHTDPRSRRVRRTSGSSAGHNITYTV